MATGPALLQVTLALAVILGLVFVAAWLFRRVGGAAIGGRNVIRVVAAAPVGTRERIMLVEVHGRQLLLGVTSAQITQLHLFDADVAPVAVVAPDFRATLKTWMKRS